MDTPINFEPPPSFPITDQWQPINESLRAWLLPVRATMGGRTTRERVPFTCGTVAGSLRLSRGKGASRGLYIHMTAPGFRVLIDLTHKRIRLYP